jgi:hypothetical protein
MMLRRLLATGAVGVVLVCAACGAAGEKVTVEATPAAMRRSAEATLSKGASRVESTTTMSIKGHEVNLTSTGVQDPANKRFQMDFDTKELFSQLAGDQSLPPGAGAAFDEPMTVLVDGTVMYIRLPALAKLGGRDKEWLKLDVAKLNEEAGDLLGAGAGGGALGSDPSSFLQFLEGAGKVDEVGTEEVRSVTTRHFSGSYTIRDSLAALPDDQRERVEKAFTGLGLPASAEDQEIPFDVWIDDGGLVRRMSTSFDAGKLAPGGAGASLGTVTSTSEYFDFGTKVDIQIPSDDEVRDFSALVGQGQPIN